MFISDRLGYAPEDDYLSWRGYTGAAYKRLTEKYKPFGFYGVAMGYGQVFVTETALLYDR